MCLCVVSLWGNDRLEHIEKRFLESFQQVFPEGALGLEVYSTQKDSVLHAIGNERLMRPASTLKILATAAALDTLDPMERFESKVELRGERYGKTFWGDIHIDPQGNPGFTGRFYNHPSEALKPIAENLKALGIDTLWGSLKISRNYLAETSWPKTWEKKFKDRCFAPKVETVAFNENCARLVVEPSEKVGGKPLVYTEPYLGFFDFENNAETSAGKRKRIQFSLSDSTDKIMISGDIGVGAKPFSAAVPLRDPEAYFQRGLAYTLMMEGITYFPQQRKEDAPLYREFFLKTVTLNDVIQVINTRSHNLFAELILRKMGEVYFGQASLENGVKAVKSFLKKVGVKDTNQVILDGSGLSYQNRIQPAAMNAILKYMLKHPHRKSFIESLNYATEPGASGTRMLNLIYPYGVRFKTGFVAETQGLVGYVFTATGDTLAVSFLVNGYKVDDWSARKFMDSLWTQLTYDYDRERASLLEMENLFNKGDSLQKLEKRFDFFSKFFLERPYHSPPTGEGTFGEIKQEALVNSSAFDCVTFIEHVMSLVYAKDSTELFSVLQKIRYQNGVVDFDERNHFFVEDWLKNNRAWVEVDTNFSDRDSVKVTDKKKFAGFFKKTYSQENPQTRLRYISMEKADSLFNKPWEAESQVFGVALLGDLDWLWITHTGFLILEKGQLPLFRHASSKEKKVVEMPFAKYLKTRKNVHGVTLFRFKEGL